MTRLGNFDEDPSAYPSTDLAPKCTCHCGSELRPALCLSLAGNLAWFQCRGCGYRSPLTAWDGTVHAHEAAIKAWDYECTLIRQRVGLKPKYFQKAA